MRKGTSEAKSGEGVRINNQAPTAPPTRLVDAETQEDRGTVLEFLPVTKQSTEESRPQRHCAGPICDFRIEPEPDQNRERQQRPSTGNRIDHACSKCGAQHDKRGEETHRWCWSMLI